MIYTEIESTLTEDGQPAAFRRLWAAVLLQAVRDWAACARRDMGITCPGNFSQNTLYKWFTSKDVDVGTFHWICVVLDLEPGSLREQVFNNPQVLTAMRKAA